MKIDDLIKFAVSNNASDLHISGNESPVMRIAGRLREVDIPPLTEEEVQTMILETLSEKDQIIYKEEQDIDYSYEVEGIARLRANAFVGTRGPCAAFRIIRSNVIPWDTLGLPDIIKNLSEKEKGLILITGPAGCGKSTTMTSFVDVINSTRAAHILTVEDPVEYIHTPKKSIITHREVGRDTKSFATALKGALREDPDVILVGEMRDRETMQLALTAAETGHLVISTLHTNSAPKTINRIINTFSSKDQGQIRTMLGEGLLAVVSQVLVPKRDKKTVAPAFEILYATSAVRSMVRANKLYEIPSAIETGMKYDMRSLHKSLSRLIIAGTCSRDECKKFTDNPNNLPFDPDIIYESKEENDPDVKEVRLPVSNDAKPSPRPSPAPPPGTENTEQVAPDGDNKTTETPIEAKSQNYTEQDTTPPIETQNKTIEQTNPNAEPIQEIPLSAPISSPTDLNPDIANQ